ncbi:MAG: 16S rRNA (guanine(966)-N(2))-methyltransferase RsmD [Coriobacteriia bacterium]|nr:16S rRNA (guanine(966)-N(2))-methyltransferase RsmD [Coriobacteriia bacterium]
MRIIAGQFKGHTIAAVAGVQTRPTTDRVREAWASSITSIREGGFSGARVLDTFAGSGALGLEAISRGAASAVFVDNSERAVRTIRQNLDTLNISGDKNYRVIKADVLSPAMIRRLDAYGPFDCIFLDPPYDYHPSRIGAFLSTLIDFELLLSGCLVSYERRAVKQPVQNAPGSLDSGETDWPQALKMVYCRQYGIAQIEYYIFERNAS